jgi:hypothetical protein
VAKSVVQLAVSDDGSALLLSTPASEGFALWMITSGDTTGTLLVPSGTAAFAFRRNSRDAVVASENGNLLLVQNGGAQIQIEGSHTPAQSDSRINGVQLAVDGRRIYTSHPSGVAAYDLDSQTWTEMSCTCTPQGLYPFGRVNLFRLTDSSQGPIFLLDVSDARQIHVWFIPHDGTHKLPHRSARE